MYSMPPRAVSVLTTGSAFSMADGRKNDGRFVWNMPIIQ